MSQKLFSLYSELIVCFKKRFLLKIFKNESCCCTFDICCLRIGKNYSCFVAFKFLVDFIYDFVWKAQKNLTKSKLIIYFFSGYATS